ncbi:MAG: methionine adenosyltransferase [Microbacteriaceae bacterium]|jgi:S-adenosylmethionine synthetase|nr:methionine adenosyltransferase [Microbacteriaceae bacterium]MCI1206757.1 methionine adenosyltransferase [Microbacteriaceae bacterium]
MSAQTRLISSESVTEGHPDKLCDQVSDAILDELLRGDPEAHAAVETVATNGLVQVVGEVKTTTYVEIPDVVRRIITGIGYTSSDIGFDGASCGVSISIGQQSPEIDDGVENSYETRHGSTDPLDARGAGDQGIMFGYASDETPQLMPAPITLAHALARRLSTVRREGTLPYLRPDGKSQVTLRYEDNVPVSVETVVLSAQHHPDISNSQLESDLAAQVISPVLDRFGLPWDRARVLINSSGRFVLGGPRADAGLTGRKIIVDTYGGAAHHGGGAFSGKDPSKVDRSGAYALRWVAKNAVAAGLAARMEVQAAYAIGAAHPVGLYVDTFGTGVLPDEQIAEILKRTFDLRPLAIIRDLELKHPRYLPTAAFGHFGREEPGFTWERLDRVERLREIAGL